MADKRRLPTDPNMFSEGSGEQQMRFIGELRGFSDKDGPQAKKRKQSLLGRISQSRSRDESIINSPSLLNGLADSNMVSSNSILSGIGKKRG